jgi:hypothetical protein
MNIFEEYARKLRRLSQWARLLGLHATAIMLRRAALLCDSEAEREADRAARRKETVFYRVEVHEDPDQLGYSLYRSQPGGNL